MEFSFANLSNNTNTITHLNNQPQQNIQINSSENPSRSQGQINGSNSSNLINLPRNNLSLNLSRMNHNLLSQQEYDSFFRNFPEEEFDNIYDVVYGLNEEGGNLSDEEELINDNNEIQEEIEDSNMLRLSHQNTSTVNSNDLFSNDNGLFLGNNSPTSKSHIEITNKGIKTQRKHSTKLNRLNNSMKAIPYSKFDRFKQGMEFKIMETCFYYINKLIIKSQGKFDFESDEGNEICREGLEQVEMLGKALKIGPAGREYRKKFTKAYLFLYEENSLGYCAEIGDSAQETTPYLVVNEEKFIFSKDVLDSGSQGFMSFCAFVGGINESVNTIYEEVTYDYIDTMVNEIKTAGSDFDKKWAIYEEKYINELIYIENISRRFIGDGINIEKEGSEFERKAKIRGKTLYNNTEYNGVLERFGKVINNLNKLANLNGKGRDDGTVDILQQSEKVLCTISDIKSKGMRKGAFEVRRTGKVFRDGFKKYSLNIEGVDPQLVNNTDLVDALYDFEIVWEKGKTYLTNKNKFNQLLEFNQIIEVINEKYEKNQIKIMISQSAPEIFVSGPLILILRGIDNGSNTIVKDYIPNIFNTSEENGRGFEKVEHTIKRVYKAAGDNNVGYNGIEKFLGFEETKEESAMNKDIWKYLSKEEGNEFKKDIKIISMNMQRYKPTEWNEFFELAMDIE